jgi:hypothetical protein
VRRAQVERVARPARDVAVADVAVAASVAEDRERADVPGGSLARRRLVCRRIVHEDAALVRRPRVVDAVEDEVDAAELLARLANRHLERSRVEALHGVTERVDSAES